MEIVCCCESVSNSRFCLLSNTLHLRYIARRIYRKMALPLVAIYYGLLIIGSILFLQVYDQDKFIDGGHQIIDTISDRKELLMNKIAPYVNEVTEKFNEQFHHEKQTTMESAYETVTNTVAAKKAVHIYDKIVTELSDSIVGKFLQKIWAEVEQFLVEHPVFCETKNKMFALINNYAEIIYNFSAEKLTFLSEVGPIKHLFAEYGKLHNDYVTPYVESSSEYVSKYIDMFTEYVGNGIGEENLKSSTELTYTFFIVIIAVFMCKLALTKVLRMFVKDAFQMNRSVSDMYKNSLRNTTHSPIYETIKQKSEHAMIIDELELVEVAEAAANSTTSSPSNASNRNIPGSNRNTAGSNRREEEHKEEQQQQQKEEQEEVVKKNESDKSQSSRSASISSTTSSLRAPVQPPRTASTTTHTAPVTVHGTKI